MTIGSRPRPVHIWLFRLAESGLSREPVTSLLTDGDRSELDGRPARRIRARIALRLALAETVGSKQAGEELARSSLGRPFLRSGAAAFSVSHTADFALIAIAVADAGPTERFSADPPAPNGLQLGSIRSDLTLGVDIEQARPLRLSDRRRNTISRAAIRYGTARRLELAPDVRLNVGPPTPDPIIGFLADWVRLEAIAKASGRGIFALLADHGVIGVAAGETRRDRQPHTSQISLWQAAGADVCLAVACEPTMLPEPVRCGSELL